MKFPLVLACLLLAQAACSNQAQVPDRSVLLPGFKPVPTRTIKSLPAKIERLPVTESMTVADFLKALGLSEYDGNIAGSVRFNSYFLKLDDAHTLQIRCDPDSLAIRKEVIDRLLSGAPVPREDSRFYGARPQVVGCTLRKDWNQIIAHRWLATEDVSNH